MEIAFRRARRAFAFCAVAAIVAVPAALGGASEKIGEVNAPAATAGGSLVSDSSSMYFIEFSGSKADFTSQAKEAGLRYTERYSYGKLFNGISVKLGSAERGKLAGFSSVKAVWPVHTIALEPTSTTDLATAIVQTGADLAQAAGWTGAGVKVAIMDTVPTTTIRTSEVTASTAIPPAATASSTTTSRAAA